MQEPRKNSYTLRQAVVSCQTRIEREVIAAPRQGGMGSTLTLACIVWPRLFLAHVGDSRCYLLRDGEIHQLTRDHTLAGLLHSSQESPRKLRSIKP